MPTAAEYLKKPYGRLLVPEEDGGYRGEIIEFPGVFAEGETAAETAANLEDAAESWLEATIARGQTIPKPLEELEYSGKLVVRLPKSLHRRAAYTANREGVSLNQFIVSSIAENVGAYRWSIFNTSTTLTISFSVKIGTEKAPSVYGQAFQPFERTVPTQTVMLISDQSGMSSYA